MAKRYRVTLTAEEREALSGMISRGKADARKLAHARVLLQADASEGGPDWTDTRIAEAVRVSVRTIERVRQRFVEDGLEAALLPRPSTRVPHPGHERGRKTQKKECAQAAPAADVVHSAKVFGRVRVPHGRRAGGLS